MNIKQSSMILLLSLLINGCFSSDVNFMGADKYIGGGSFVERWYINPKYERRDIPKGSAFYGASAQKIKHKFIIKYYQKTEDGNDDILMSRKDLWKIKHNGKDWRDQDDEKLFYYIKRHNKYIKRMEVYNKKRRGRYDVVNHDEGLLAVKECYEDGWCKLYPNVYEKEDIYIYKSILDKPLSDK